MAKLCSSSVSISLPSILRSLYCSEFAPRTQYQYISALNPTSPLHRGCRNKRSFSSTLLIRTPNSQLTHLDPTDKPVATKLDKTTNETLNEIITTSAPAAKPTKTRVKKGGEKKDADFRATSSHSVSTKSPHARKNFSNDRIITGFWPKKKRESWQIQKDALKKKFEAGWSPPKKLSPDALEGIRHLHAVAPEQFTTPVLAEQFKVSPEAIRRILKSKWRPSESELEERKIRWERRHERIWSHMSELGLRPKTKRAEPLSDSNRIFRGDDSDVRGKE